MNSPSEVIHGFLEEMFEGKAEVSTRIVNSLGEFEVVAKSREDLEKLTEAIEARDVYRYVETPVREFRCILDPNAIPTEHEELLEWLDALYHGAADAVFRGGSRELQEFARQKGTAR